MRLDGIGYRNARRLTLPITALMLGLSLLLPLNSRAATQEPGGRFRVLVVPLESSALDKRFGGKVADAIMERLEEFTTHVPIPEKEFKRALKRYEVKLEDLNPIKARQLANLMGAQVVFVGSVTPAGALFQLEAGFIDVKTGDEVRVPELTIRDKKDESVQAVTDAAITAFESQVRFIRARAFCAEYVGSQQPENALRNCNEALAINPNSVPAMFNKAMAFRQLFENAEREGTNGSDVGLENSYADTAIFYFERVLELQPGHPDALQNAAYIYSKVGDAERAAEYYRQYLEFDPTNVPVRLKVAYDLAQAGVMREAIDIIQGGLDHVDQDNPNYAKNKVDLLQFLGDYALRYSSEDSTYVDIALDAYEEVLELKGEEADLTIVENAIAAYTRANRFDEAIEFAELALGSHEDSPRLWSLYADALGRAERYNEAAEAMNQVLQLDATYKNGYLRRGRFKLQGGDEASAMADFAQAIESGTSTSADVFSLFWSEGHAARNSGDLAGAISNFERAVRFAEAGQQAQELEFWWGYTLYQLGEKIAGNDGAGLNQLRRAGGYFQAAQQHKGKAGSVRSEAPQLREAAGKWLLNVEARIKQLSRE